jgi:hypothetical protein
MVPIKLFFSYSHKDEELRGELENHLKILLRQGVLSQWHDRNIEAGDRWAKEIDRHLDEADVILLLVSADFLASDYCYSKEMKRALERQKKGCATVIPVILRPVDWQDAPFANLQALPKDARAVTLWSNRDEAYTNIARSIRQICRKLQNSAPKVRRTSFPSIEVLCADVTDVECDVLLLKYAQTNCGVDAAVSKLLSKSGVTPKEIQPLPGKYSIVESNGVVSPRTILFVGVLPLSRFDYAQIREFGNYALEALARVRTHVEHACLTMHGAGYGLDERESFLSLLAGLFEGLAVGAFPESLERISIVEKNAARAKRLRKLLQHFNSQAAPSAKSRPTKQTTFEKQFDAGLNSGSKAHVFVAMPFTPETEDVFIFGIQGPVHAAGHLCERVDFSSFTGDIVSRIRSRIETASLVIADLTGANPNVYLEVGYAWGKDKPTLFISNSTDSLKFDVKTHRCIIYKTINELAKRLRADLETLL